MYTIKKGVPIPEKTGSKGIAETLRLLEVGDCAEFPIHCGSGSLDFVKRKTGFKFTQRRINGKTVIWRIE